MKNHRMFVSLYSSTRLLLMVLVFGLLLSACSQAAVSQNVATPQADSENTIILPYQVDGFPRETNSHWEGRRSLVPFLEDVLEDTTDISKSDLEGLELRLVLPATLPDTERLSDTYISQMALSLVGPSASGAIEIDSFSTQLQYAELNNEAVIYGYFVGDLVYPDGHTVEVTISGAAIVEQRQGRFNMIITAHRDIPAVPLQMGNLEWTPELDTLVNSRYRSSD